MSKICLGAARRAANRPTGASGDGFPVFSHASISAMCGRPGPWQASQVTPISAHVVPNVFDARSNFASRFVAWQLKQVAFQIWRRS
jgi:hypothetical protein